MFVFPIFWSLDAGIGDFWPQIRILREISSLEPAPKVWKPKSRSQNVGFIVYKQMFPSLSRAPEGYKVRSPVRKSRDLIAFMCTKMAPKRAGGISSYGVLF